ncbi:MAG: hypothetical protein LBK73_06530 [Treponema sp.]|nr:hypothetical protein [Treponema sp.]
MAEEAGVEKRFPYIESTMKKERMTFTIECDSPPPHALYKPCYARYKSGVTSAPATSDCNQRLQLAIARHLYSTNIFA